MLRALLIAVIIAALIFEFINGFHDTANAIATTVYTKALPVNVAIAMSAVMNFIGALASEKVAMTIATGLVDVELKLYVILSALIGAILWDLFTWWKSIPSSSSHALIGALVGAAMVYTHSTQHIVWSSVVNKVVIPIFLSPAIGLVFGYCVMKLIFFLLADWTYSKANGVAHKAQIFTSAIMAYSHGNNDAQKTMGIVTLALVTGGVLSADTGIPLWVKIMCALTMALGTSIGGQRIMKTVGSGVTKLDPVLGFCSQISGAVAIEIMTFLGAPVSTTQVLTTAIMGAGSAKRVTAVKWGIAKTMLKAWIITLPITIVLGGAVCGLIGIFM